MRLHSRLIRCLEGSDLDSTTDNHLVQLVGVAGHLQVRWGEAPAQAICLRAPRPSRVRTAC